MAAATASMAARHHREIVTDQRGQKSRGAEFAVRGGDAAMRPTVGSSLNSTPPPPLTWVSMKPGNKQDVEIVALRLSGGIVVATISAMRRLRPARHGFPAPRPA